MDEKIFRDANTHTRPRPRFEAPGGSASSGEHYV